jgi:superoxide dismutase, Fe-Mn family
MVPGSDNPAKRKGSRFDALQRRQLERCGHVWHPSATGTSWDMTKYTLPDLPYPYDALEPWCAAETLKLHHDKHHAAYVKGANEAAAALANIDPADAQKLAGVEAALTFNLGGHVLHSLFWQNLSPTPTSANQQLLARIETDLGSASRAKNLLVAACMGVQGSGWGALMFDKVGGTLRVASLRDHHQDLVPGTTVLAVVDVWEHAYYLGYKNDRAAWVAAAIDHLDWPTISARFDEAANPKEVR